MAANFALGEATLGPWAADEADSTPDFSQLPWPVTGLEMPRARTHRSRRQPQALARASHVWEEGRCDGAKLSRGTTTEEAELGNGP